MGTLLKWLLGLLLGVIVLVAAAVVILPMVIDPNDYKPQIVAQAEQQLGREFAIERDLSLTVFPWLGVETGGIRVGNAAGFEAPTFAEIDTLSVRVKLLPLLSQRVEVDTLVLTGLRLNLEKDANGNTNWADLAAGDAAEDEAAPAETATDEGTAGPAIDLRVNGIEITEARIAWTDRQAGQEYVLEGVRLVTGAISPGSQVPVEAGVRFSSSQPAMILDAALEAAVTADEALAVFDVAGLDLVLDAEGEGLPAGGAKLQLNADIAADLGAGTVTVDGLRIRGPAMEAQGDLRVTSLQSDPAAQGSLSIAETNPKTLASMFAVVLETTDPEALTRVSGNLDIAYQGGALKLDPLRVALDDSTLQGHLHLLDFAGPTVRTRLALDEIDLDRYMPPATTGEAAAEPSAGADKPASDDPFAALRPLDFEGDFEVGKLKVSNLRMNDISTRIVSKKGVLEIDPMGAKLYQGSLDGRVQLDASTKTPKLAARQALVGIQVGPLLQDLAGQDRLQGQGEVKLDLRMVGMSEAEIRRTLNGTSSFAFRDGAVKGVNIAKLIRDASAALGLGGDQLDVGTPGQTDFSEMSGSVKITDGVVRNDDLQAKSPLLRVAGRGEVDLPNNSIDYRLTTELVKSLAGQGGKAADELTGVPIPIRVSGSLNGPSVRPDLEQALSAKAKQQLEEKKQEVLDKVEEKAKGKLDDALKGLFR
jgi:AsmA protein